jgi:hypothetical protein
MSFCALYIPPFNTPLLTRRHSSGAKTPRYSTALARTKLLVLQLARAPQPREPAAEPKKRTTGGRRCSAAVRSHWDQRAGCPPSAPRDRHTAHRPHTRHTRPRTHALTHTHDRRREEHKAHRIHTRHSGHAAGRHEAGAPGPIGQGGASTPAGDPCGGGVCRPSLSGANPVPRNPSRSPTPADWFWYVPGSGRPNPPHPPKPHAHSAPAPVALRRALSGYAWGAWGAWGTPMAAAAAARRRDRCRAATQQCPCE